MQKYDTNPLVESGEIKSKQKTVRAFGTDNMVDTITGEVLAGTAVVVCKMVDEEHFASFYIASPELVVRAAQHKTLASFVKRQLN